jgi:mRNA interferase RelE/StbE
MSLGKPLKGMFKGLYRYRFGAYRIMYAVDMGQKEILVLRVGHRKEVYSE